MNSDEKEENNSADIDGEYWNGSKNAAWNPIEPACLPGEHEGDERRQQENSGAFSDDHDTEIIETQDLIMDRHRNSHQMQNRAAYVGDERI